MQDYNKLVEALRCCAGANTKPTKCPDYGDSCGCGGKCLDKHLITAADAIEALQAEVKRLQDKLCDWCAVCPKERREPDDCELLGENPVMYVPSGAKMGMQDESISKFADGEWWKEARK